MAKFSKIVCFSLPVLCFTAALLYAQPAQFSIIPTNAARFEYISTEQGLSHNRVNAILQDSKGFMWFGTSDGLNRYDGYDFKVYRYDSNDTTSISGNSITSLDEDNSGALWIGTYSNGVNKFDRETETFTRYKFTNKWGMNHIRGVYQDKNDMVWVATFNGLFQLYEAFNDSTGRKSVRIKHFRPAFSEHTPTWWVPTAWAVLKIFEDRLGKLWIGGGGGIFSFNKDTESFTRYKMSETHDTTSIDISYDVSDIYEDDSGVLWLTTARGLTRFNSNTNTFTRYNLDPNIAHNVQHNRVHDIYADDFGKLWILTDKGGLSIFNKKTKKFTEVKKEPSSGKISGALFIWSTYLDNTGTHWITTPKNGVMKYIPAKEKMTNTIPVISIDNPTEVKAFYEDAQDTLWVAAKEALIKYHKKTGTYRYRKYNREDPAPLYHYSISRIHEDEQGILWLGTDGGGIIRFDGTTRNLAVFEDTSSINWINQIEGLAEDQSGNIWTVTHQGRLNRFDKKMNQYKAPLPPIIGGLRNIIRDSFGTLWCGTWEAGLVKFAGISPLDSTHYLHNPSDRHSLSNNHINLVYEDQFHNLWIGTPDGLNRFIKKKVETPEQNESEAQPRFERVYSEDGLVSDNILGILDDDRGNIWISTPKGISKITPGKGDSTKTISVKNYDSNDGIRIRFSLSGATYKGRDGTLYFGGDNGFLSFHPDSLQDNAHIPPLVITEFKILNELADLDTNITEKKHIILSHKENFFSLEFAALDYMAPAKNRYAYMLEGVDNTWIYSEDRRIANYTNVAPGEYTFRVKGANNDGVWNEEGTSVAITILPPWWQTWWAYSFYLILLVSVIYILRRYELNRQRLKLNLELKQIHAEKLEEVDRLKAHFFANISHEFRTPLTLILGPVEQMRSGKFKGNLQEQYRLILLNGRRLLQLINQLLDLSKLESGKMVLQARPENIIPLLNGLTQSFESLAKQKNITLKFQAPSVEVIAYVDREKFEKVVVNLVSNAFKFTPEGGNISLQISDISDQLSMNKNQLSMNNKNQLSVNNDHSGDRELKTDNCLLITVSDTGRGIPAERLPFIFDRFYQVDDSAAREYEGTGIGLALTKELVALHHGSISAESEVGKGTTFTVRLPLGKEHLKISDLKEPLPKGPQESTIPQASPKMGFIDPKSEIRNPKSPKGQAEIVLIVEDNPDMRTFMRGYLEELYHIEEAENGAEGLQQARKSLPDLIISDVMMPAMDGMQFCREIKTDERTSHIPVILLTARAGETDKIEGLETGADDYLTKPFNARELQVRVKNLIEQRQRLRQKFLQGTYGKNGFTIQPTDVTVTSMDAAFLEKALAVVEANMSDSDFDTTRFAREVGMSRSYLSTKLQALTGHPTREFLRILRLKRAAQLLQQQFGNVTDVAFEVGFNNSSYFAQAFRKEFGISPSEYATTQKNKKAQLT